MLKKYNNNFDDDFYFEDMFYVGVKQIDKELFLKHWSKYFDSKYNYSTKKKKKK